MRAITPCGTSSNSQTITYPTLSCPCPSSITVTHTAGTIAPVTKTVTYGVVTSTLSGSTFCWITQNLGASNQPSSATDNTEAAAGWYWQFNRKQGFKHDGSTRTPSSTWIATIDENSDWQAANDPCTLLLGTGWRLPTNAEWSNAVVTGGWNSLATIYASVLKLHGPGYLDMADGSLGYRGSYCQYWSSTQNTTTKGDDILFWGSNGFATSASKAYGNSVRCVK